MSIPVCAIVGAGEGLGQALAARFAGEGFALGLVSRSREGSAAAIEAGSAIRAEFFPADAAQPETIERALARVEAELGPVEILIYNVRGEFTRRDPLDMTYDELENIYRVEVVGAFAAARAVIPAMRERGTGSVMFSSATAAFRGSAIVPLYAIGKFALRGLSQSLTKAYAKDGVHVVHMRLDCDLDVPLMRKAYGDSPAAAQLADPDAVALTYWLTHQQPKSAWSNEVEIRPHTEKWTY